jgi:hypothetical protein
LSSRLKTHYAMTMAWKPVQIVVKSMQIGLQHQQLLVPMAAQNQARVEAGHPFES